MKIVLVSATVGEIQPVLAHLDQLSLSEYEYREHRIVPLVTGVGSPATAFALGRFRNFGLDDLILHVGISGSYTPEIAPGSVVEVIEERWADLGAENADGSLIDLYELGLANPTQKPYKGGVLMNKKSGLATGLPQVSGQTVNMASGTPETIRRVHRHPGIVVESMEGAAVFYAAAMWDIPLISVRAISNLVAIRDKTKWNIPLAIQNLNEFIINFLDRN